MKTTAWIALAIALFTLDLQAQRAPALAFDGPSGRLAAVGGDIIQPAGSTFTQWPAPDFLAQYPNLSFLATVVEMVNYQLEPLRNYEAYYIDGKDITLFSRFTTTADPDGIVDRSFPIDTRNKARPVIVRLP